MAQKKNNKTILWLGVLVIIGAVLIFARNAQKGHIAESELIGKKAAPGLNIENWVTPEPPDSNSLSGKPYVLEFWATWCPPCVESIPHIKELAEKYNGKVEFIAISVDSSDEPVKKMVDEKNINYNVGMDNGLSDKYGVRGIPAAFMISKEGTIVWSGHPQTKEFEKQLEKIAE
jgi:thiol-disulfide isomerase/thioredoxin